MKILLLNPKTIYESWPITDLLKYICKVYCLALPQLCATVPEYDCDMFNGLVEHCSLKEFFRMLSSYDVIGISAVSAPQSLSIEITIKVIKKIDRNKIIILGGHHATAYHKEWIQKGADIVVRNESEISFPLVIEALSQGRGSSLSGIKGITYREGDDIKVNTDMEFIQNLDTLPLPRWDKINFFKTVPLSKYKGYTICVETSRGCIYNCVFCSVPPMWRHTQRFKSVGRVIKEFEYLYDLGIRNIEIADDNFGAFYERDKEIFSRLINKNIDVNIGAFMRADYILEHPDLIETAARAGLREILIGYESCDDTELDIYNKRLANMGARDYLEVYKILRGNGVFVIGSFVKIPLQTKSNSNKIDISKICDIPLYADYIPTKDHISFSELMKRNLISLDTFYYIMYLYRHEKLRTKAGIVRYLKTIMDLFNLNAIKYLVFGSSFERDWIYSTYVQMFKHLFCRLSLRRVIDFLICISKKYSTQEKQSMILSRYLKDDYILRLVNKKLQEKKGGKNEEVIY